MSVFLALRRRLWLKLLLALAVVVVLTFSAMIFINVTNQSDKMKDLVRRDGLKLAQAVEEGMADNLATAKNDAVRRQFQSLKRNMPDTSVYVFDFEYKVAFATEADSINRSIMDRMEDEPAKDSLHQGLENKNSKTELFETTRNGLPYSCVLRPILNEPRCFHCHGKSRVVLGGMLVMTSDEENLAATRAIRNINVLVGAAGLFGLTLIIFFLVRRLVGRPVEAAITAIKGLAEGDLRSRVTVTTTDELGVLSDYFNTFADKLAHVLGEVTQNVHGLTSASVSLAEVSGQLAASSDEMSGQSDLLAGRSDDAQNKLDSIAASIGQVSTVVQGMAMAVAELTKAIAAVSRDAGNSARSAETATRTAGRAGEAVHGLQDSAKGIGQVTEVIGKVADRTTMLALNATIEAARAGKTGAGFAVVAGEVKDLAGQTAGSTADIKDKITDIQGHIGRAAQAIEEVLGVIREAEGLAQGMAAAVEEQSATTNELAQRVSVAAGEAMAVAQSTDQVAQINREINTAVKQVSRRAHESARAAARVRSSADDLSGMAEALQVLVKQFKS